MDKYYKFLNCTQLEPDDRVQLGGQQLWLSERRRDLALVRSSKAGLNLTDVIGVAADHVFAETAKREATRRVWREMSADAHVLGWSLFQRTSFGPADRRTGVGEGTASGSPERLAEPFLASYGLVRQGWSLFDRRCEEPSNSSH